jgi:hypothetical protein
MGIENPKSPKCQFTYRLQRDATRPARQKSIPLPRIMLVTNVGWDAVDAAASGA